MTIVVECGHCGRRSGAKDEWVGKSVRCPGCGERVVVGGAAPPSEVPQQPARPAATRRPPPQTRPAAPAPQQARPAARPPQQPPAAARSAQRPAGLPQAARRAPPPRTQAAIPAAPAASPLQPPDGGIMDLLGGDFGAGAGGVDPFAGGPMGAGARGGPLGPPPRRKKGSNKNAVVFIVLGVVGVMMLMCGGVAFVVLPPAIQAARRAAGEAQARNAARASRVGSSPSSSGSFFGRSSASTPAWTPNPQYAGQLTTRVSFDRFNMQLPQGFTHQPTPPSPPQMRGARVQNWLWVGPEFQGGGRGAVEVDLVDMSGVRGVKKASPDELPSALPQLFSKLSRNAHIMGLAHDPGERGRLAGCEAIRARFSGNIESTRVEGIVYVVLDGQQRILMLFCFLPQGSSDPTRDLLEASFLTVQ